MWSGKIFDFWTRMQSGHLYFSQLIRRIAIFCLRKRTFRLLAEVYIAPDLNAINKMGVYTVQEHNKQLWGQMHEIKGTLLFHITHSFGQFVVNLNTVLYSKFGQKVTIYCSRIVDILHTFLTSFIVYCKLWSAVFKNIWAGSTLTQCSF